MKKDVFDFYLSEICKRFNLTSEQFFSRTKNREITKARHFLYWMCSHRHISVTAIQKYMLDHGYKTAHSTIIMGIRRAEKTALDDRDYVNISRIIERGI